MSAVVLALPTPEPVRKTTLIAEIRFRVRYWGRVTISRLTIPGRGLRTWNDARISDLRFPQQRVGLFESEGEIVSLPEDMEAEMAAAYLRADGLEPANAAEILAAGNASTKIYRLGQPVLALGQEWQDGRFRSVVALGGTAREWFARPEDLSGRLVRGTLLLGIRDSHRILG